MACEQCGGIGLVRRQIAERWVSTRCSCQAEAAAVARIRRTQIPAGFEHATLENFHAGPHTTLSAQLLLARRYVEEFLLANNQVTDRPAGLLYTGGVGAGKTHLAVGIARAIALRGFQPLFVYVADLLERLRRSYDRDAQETQAQVMSPIWAADLVVVDELGAQRPTDWTFDTIEILIGGLYNRTVATIVTTNFPNLPPGGGMEQPQNGYQRAARPETLGDRIGSRMWSRLQQICRHADLAGAPDWRTKRP